MVSFGFIEKVASEQRLEIVQENKHISQGQYLKKELYLHKSIKHEYANCVQLYSKVRWLEGNE